MIFNQLTVAVCQTKPDIFSCQRIVQYGLLHQFC